MSRMTHSSSLGCAWPASLQLAVRALVDVPMWARVTHGAVPENEGRIRLDHLERVCAV